MSLTIVSTPEWRTGAVLADASMAERSEVVRLPDVCVAIPSERPTATAARLSVRARGVRGASSVRGVSGVRGGTGCTSRLVAAPEVYSLPPEESVGVPFRAMQAAAVGMVAVAGSALLLACWQLGEFLVALF
jgi:hypothetical protein